MSASDSSARGSLSSAERLNRAKKALVSEAYGRTYPLWMPYALDLADDVVAMDKELMDAQKAFLAVEQAWGYLNSESIDNEQERLLWIRAALADVLLGPLELPYV